MKVLIVSLGLLLVGVTFVIYQGDMSRYLQIQTFVKAVAEECAAGAALYYDEEAYSRGSMVIRQEEAVKYIDHLVEEAADQLRLSEGEGISYELQIAGEKGGMRLLGEGGGTDTPGENGGDSPAGQSPWVEVTLRLKTKDLFRLPFLKAEQVVRSGKYELADYGAR